MNDQDSEAADKAGKGAEIKNMSEALDFIEARGVAQGVVQGRCLQLIDLVHRKLQKGYAPEDIAEILEEDPAHIQDICEIITEDLEHFDANAVYEKMEKRVMA